MPTNGAAIRYHRQVAGWTLAVLSQRAKVSASYLSKLENGAAKATPPVLRRIADALDLSVRDLMPEADRLSIPA